VRIRTPTVYAKFAGGIIKRIQEHGFEVGEKKLGADNSWQVWLEDPDGVRLSFTNILTKVSSCRAVSVTLVGDIKPPLNGNSS
jgi:hypothetical protein